MNLPLASPTRPRAGVFLASATVLALAVLASPAHAQWGFGGWGGWEGGVGTVQGSIAQGMGALAVGMGVGANQEAQANAINTDTIMRWNQYMFQSQQEANQRVRERQLRGSANIKKARAEIESRLRDNPNSSDISRGDALNVALDEINNPRVYLRGLKGAQAKLPGTLVRDIPFQYAAAAITTSVDHLVKGGPPASLQTDAFASDREALKKIAAELRQQNEEKGNFDPATLEQGRQILKAARAKVEATIPRNTRDRREAETYLKGLYGLFRMLETPAIDVLLSGLEKRPETTLGALISFMEAFNLRFGAANTPRQQDAYRQLFPALDALRDEASDSLAQAKAPPPPSPLAQPGEVFETLNLDQLDPSKKTVAPK